MHGQIMLNFYVKQIIELAYEWVLVGFLTGALICRYLYLGINHLTIGSKICKAYIYFYQYLLNIYTIWNAIPVCSSPLIFCIIKQSNPLSNDHMNSQGSEKLHKYMHF